MDVSINISADYTIILLLFFHSNLVVLGMIRFKQKWAAIKDEGDGAGDLGWNVWENRDIRWMI